MTDSNYPGSGTYKALITDGTNRVACTSANCATGGAGENINWVLTPSTEYFRTDGTTEIGVTTSAGIFSFPLSNAITASGVAWTGFADHKRLDHVVEHLFGFHLEQ